MNLDAMSTSSGDSVMTPTYTSVPESSGDHELPSYYAAVAVAPRAGSTFIIRDPRSKLVVTLNEGWLGMAPGEREDAIVNPYNGRGSHWCCVENNERWLGFKNKVSGTFIGHDNRKNEHWRFIATVDQHRDWEFFCVRQHPDGGHELLVKHNNGFRAMTVGGADNKNLMVAGEGRSGTRWEFLEI